MLGLLCGSVDAFCYTWISRQYPEASVDWAQTFEIVALRREQDAMKKGTRGRFAYIGKVSGVTYCSDGIVLGNRSRLKSFG